MYRKYEARLRDRESWTKIELTEIWFRGVDSPYFEKQVIVCVPVAVVRLTVMLVRNESSPEMQIAEPSGAQKLDPEIFAQSGGSDLKLVALNRSPSSPGPLECELSYNS